jgi:uncharacterized protein YegP (UPF0339 family)
MGKFVITKRSNSEYQFNLLAVNNEVILTSEGYTAISSCRNGIESVREHSKQDSNYVRKTSADNKYYFNLKASNGEVIGTSEMYEAASGRDKGIESVKENAKAASVEDNS